VAYKLTEKVPTESGYYWAMQEGGNLVIVEIDCIKYKGKITRTSIYIPGVEVDFPLSDFILWSERIEEPTEKDEKDDVIFQPQVIFINGVAKIPTGSMVMNGPLNYVNDCDLAEMRRKGLLNDPFINTSL
jgi:hypothetical protein